ncbi:MAG: hypothetical protein COT90_03370 [Candidatus Diapherotrites archaeon CG10_big_fil_rev_8_21_14_0_10_31_34]|nr:MAG: hypothetical protein COT90_03370 [Candidatus Diapherotrites archaeon CG10_big_fil_rev_8_21_14_0_10_31_34]
MVAERNNENIMLGFKMTKEIRDTILSRHGQGKYKYQKSNKGKADLKTRVYCAAIYLIFKELKRRHNIKEVSLEICRDLSGREKQIKEMLKQLLGTKNSKRGLGLNITGIHFTELIKGKSLADEYAYFLRRDRVNKLTNISCKIDLEDIESFLKH